MKKIKEVAKPTSNFKPFLRYYLKHFSESKNDIFVKIKNKLPNLEKLEDIYNISRYEFNDLNFVEIFVKYDWKNKNFSTDILTSKTSKNSLTRKFINFLKKSKGRKYIIKNDQSLLGIAENLKKKFDKNKRRFEEEEID